MCENATAPINLNPFNVKNDCSLKCSYKYDYSKSNCVVYNKGNYLNIKYDQGLDYSAFYNNLGLMINEIRIYKPSIHTYANYSGSEGNNTIGEILISHTGSGINMIVSIPITIDKISDNAMPSEAKDNLQKIIEMTAEQAPKAGETAIFNVDNFTLNNFIPKTKYYVYKGTLPYDACSGSYNYVLFDPNDAGVVISNDTRQILDKILTNNTIAFDVTNNVNIPDMSNVLVNTKGPIGPGSDVNGDGVADDDIYIDCRPTGEDGKILYEEDINFIVDAESKMKNKLSGLEGHLTFIKKLENGPVLYIIIGLIIAYVIIKLTKIIAKKASEFLRKHAKN